MKVLYRLIIGTVVLGLASPPAFAQSSPPARRIDFSAASAMSPAPSMAQRPRTAGAAMHPSAKGAIIGGAIGAGAIGGAGLWYCTIGPHEAGECSNASDWAKNFALWGAVGAGVGALIGAMR